MGPQRKCRTRALQRSAQEQAACFLKFGIARRALGHQGLHVRCGHGGEFGRVVIGQTEVLHTFFSFTAWVVLLARRTETAKIDITPRRSPRCTANMHWLS